MAAKIGILGESTVEAAGTTTLYTVDTDKAARVRVLWAVEGPNDNNMRYSILIGSSSTENIISKGSDVVNTDWWSGVREEATPNPARALSVSTVGAMAHVGGLGNLDYQERADNWAVMPFPVDYYLNAGDFVKVKVGGSALIDHLIQVQGVEDDA